MCDPWYMFILMNALGSDYIVWDYSAKIDFLKPGKNTVYATFTISEDRLKQIQDEVADGQKYLPSFETEVVDEDGETVAKVHKVLYVRRKPK